MQAAQRAQEGTFEPFMGKRGKNAKISEL